VLRADSADYISLGRALCGRSLVSQGFGDIKVIESALRATSVRTPHAGEGRELRTGPLIGTGSRHSNTLSRSSFPSGKSHASQTRS
jgi:hypothetical protein